MKKQLILMFSFMMLFAFTIDTAIAQTPMPTTRTEANTESVKKENWWKRTFGKKKKKNSTQAASKEKATKVKSPRTGGVKPAKPDTVKRPKTGGVKPAKPDVTKRPKTGGVKPAKPDAVKRPKTGGVKPAKPDVTKRPKTGGVKPTKPNKSATKKDRVEKSNDKITKGERISQQEKGEPKCGVEGCEHPGKHLGLHKHQNPVRPYKKTDQGYQAIDEAGNVIEKKLLKKGDKVKKLKKKN